MAPGAGTNAHLNLACRPELAVPADLFEPCCLERCLELSSLLINGRKCRRQEYPQNYGIADGWKRRVQEHLPVDKARSDWP